MAFQAASIFFAMICTIVGVIWLFTTGAIWVRSGHIVPPSPKRFFSNLASAGVVVLADWFSGFFWAFVSAQTASLFLAFSLGVAIFLLFPTLNTPSGDLLKKVLKFIDSPSFPRW